MFWYIDPSHTAVNFSVKHMMLSTVRGSLGKVSGRIELDPGADRERARRELLALPGIGPWTAAYLAMRTLRDPDVFLPTDVGVRHALTRLGQPADPASATALAARWRPWRSYALIHLWHSLARKDG